MFVPVKCSLRSLLGDSFIDQAVKASSFLHGLAATEAESIASKEIDFFPAEFQKSLEDLLPRIGDQVVDPITESIPGAPTDSFRKASNINASPVGGKGYYRLGENGQLFFKTVHSPDNGQTDKKGKEDILGMPFKCLPVKSQIKRNLRDQGKKPETEKVFCLAPGVLHAFDQQKDIKRKSNASDVPEDLVYIDDRLCFSVFLQQVGKGRSAEMIDQHSDQGNPF